jgi:hypothetical protein
MPNPCCCDFIYRLGAVGMHQRCNFLDLEFSSDRSWPTGMLIIFQTVSPLCKPLCHLNTALWPKASLPYACLIISNVSLADLHNFWQNLTFSCCSKCDILSFRRSQTTTLHNSDFLSEYTAGTHLLLAGTREERTRHHLVAPRIRCSAQQHHYAANPWNYWLYCVYTLLPRHR